MLAVVTPPRHFLVLDAGGEVEEHGHKRNTRIQGRGEDVVVPLPPLLPIPKHEEVEDGAHKDPSIVVESGCRWQISSCSEEHGEVDEGDPRVLRERPVKAPHDDGAEESDEEEPVEC